MGAGPRVLLAFLPEQEIDRIVKTKGLPARTKYTITNVRVLRKSLKEIREQGYALSIDDVTENGGAIGCPVWNWNGEVIAAISLSGLSSHFQGESLMKLIESVKSAADTLSRRLNAPL
jgi:DNA-binding IclR family transcriptional regulator